MQMRNVVVKQGKKIDGINSDLLTIKDLFKAQGRQLSTEALNKIILLLVLS